MDGGQLRTRVSAVAAGVLLTRYWPAKSARHQTALVVGGFVARAGFSSASASAFVGAVAQAAGDDEVHDRQRAAEDAVRAFADGSSQVYGYPELEKTFGKAVAKAVADWLAYKSEGNQASATPGATAAVGSNEGITEDMAAVAFAERYKGKLRFCHHTGAWFEWRGCNWQQDATKLAFQFARELVRELAASENDEKLRFKILKASFASAVEADRRFATTIDSWDRDPWLLGTPAGTVDLRSGVMRPGAPEDGITKLTAVAPAGQFECPLWLRFLDEATGGDHELIRFLQQWCGYALTGVTREHALVFIYGPGGNGKSVFLNVLTAIMSAYATTAAMDTFTAAKGDKHPTDLAMLRGARLVTASETEEGRLWAEARIKQLTGGDPISARFMRQDFFTFVPSFKLTIVGNHQPALRNVDEAARRRFNIVPFTRKPATPDRQLEEKLRAEWPDILRWMIEGCLDWQRHGLVRPASVQSATENYFSEQDLFAQWLADECVVDPGNDNMWSSTAELFKAWSAYAKASGEPAGTVKGFAPAMRRYGVREKRSMKARGWSGVMIPVPADKRLDLNDA